VEIEAYIPDVDAALRVVLQQDHPQSLATVDQIRKCNLTVKHAYGEPLSPLENPPQPPFTHRVSKFITIASPITIEEPSLFSTTAFQDQLLWTVFWRQPIGTGFSRDVERKYSAVQIIMRYARH
jgi:hypothetical protein